MSKIETVTDAPIRHGGQYVIDGDYPGWELKIPPDKYLERYPNGPNAELARQVLQQEGES